MKLGTIAFVLFMIAQAAPRPIYSARAELDQIIGRYPCLNWHVRHDNEVRTRDILLRDAKVDKEFNYRLDHIVNDRLKMHEANATLVRRVEQKERTLRQSKDPVLLAQLNEAFEQECADDLAKFAAAEEASEQAMVDRIARLLPADMFERFSGAVTKSSRIAACDSPLAVRWLKISPEQKLKLTVAIRNWEKASRRLEQSIGFLNDKQAFVLFEAETNFLIFAELEPEQFLKVKDMLPPWLTCRSFSDRLSWLQDSNKPKDALELKCLGELYRRGDAIESKVSARK